MQTKDDADGECPMRRSTDESFSQDRRAHRRTGWHSITGVGRNGQQVSLQICSERDDDADDGLRITVLRVPGHTTSAMPTVYAPLEGGQGA